jgi:toxin-antitoxin system PIN domain toxin
MILLDANLLIYAVNSDAPHHERARTWFENAMSGAETVAFSWGVLLAFLRITTRSGILATPLTGEQAMAYVDEWLTQPVSEVIHPGTNHWGVLRNLLHTSGTLGNLTSDAHLAAIAVENGARLYSADYDLRRFAGLRHVNPLEE